MLQRKWEKTREEQFIKTKMFSKSQQFAVLS